MIKPSNIALAISGILILTALILLYIEINKGTELKRLKLIDLLLFLSSAILYCE